MKQRTHPIRGGVFGFLFGLFLGIDLLLLGIVSSNSVAITVLPTLGLAGGVVLGFTTPLGRRFGQRAAVESTPPPAATPVSPG
jgi:hypothetical protein